MARNDPKGAEKDAPNLSDQGRQARADKDTRLAAALRRNLAERKRQQRARDSRDKKTPRESGA